MTAIVGPPGVNVLPDRCEFSTPTAPGWYGVISGDGDGEVWVSAEHWPGPDWDRNTGHAYARSVEAFPNEEAAFDWAHSQPD